MTVFAFSGLLVLIFLLSMILSVIARGPKTFFLGETRMAKPEKGQQLRDFDFDKGIWWSSSHGNTSQNA